jgi:DNA-binding PadR family transcriptional regulator
MFDHHDQARQGPGRRHHFDRPPTPGHPGFARLHGFGPFGGRGRMARRGDVRTAILALLAEKPMHGYQVIQELEARSGGRWRPSAGSIYPTLQQLEDEGLVRSEEIDGRRVFSLTEAGRGAVASREGAEAAPWDGSRGAGMDPVFELRDLGMQVGAAAMQVAHVGSPGSVESAREILTDARRRLYRLLAEEEPSGVARPEDRPASSQS